MYTLSNCSSILKDYRAEKGSERVLISVRIEEDILDDLEALQERNSSIACRSEAIRAVINLGLKTQQKPRFSPRDEVTSTSRSITKKLGESRCQ